MAYIVMAYIVMAYLAMAYIVMAYIVMATGPPTAAQVDTPSAMPISRAPTWRLVPSGSPSCERSPPASELGTSPHRAPPPPYVGVSSRGAQFSATSKPADDSHSS